MKETSQPAFRFSLTLPIVPVGVNHLYHHVSRRSQSGHRFIGKVMRPDAAFWKEQAGIIAKMALKKAGLEMIVNQKFSFDVKFWWRDKKSQLDADGALKLAVDCMNGIVYSSDKKHLPRVLDYDFDTENPRMEILIACPPTQLAEFA
jgi:Holliday junction resolvase RusA-like endonuclease